MRLIGPDRTGEKEKHAEKAKIGPNEKGPCQSRVDLVAQLSSSITSFIVVIRISMLHVRIYVIFV